MGGDLRVPAAVQPRECLSDVTPRIGHSHGTVLVSTLDGQLRALNTEDGSTKWTLQDDPVLRAPTTVKQGFTFLPNPQDGSLYMLKEGMLKRLPLSIPALVHASPLKSSDGVLYAGSKRDVWLEIDPLTGSKYLLCICYEVSVSKALGKYN
ncbi:PQQ enzyme repeat protein [Ancylostoma duodenale]|uniref:PQQ enzyme repeat protein n=1 Tax=Ancylostoma duodenale TaxID=51022 RepID=A0A0C2GN22_9BILA|nr:PQQ enzyme repeat protein [Ancylostoma duodenale]